MTRDDFADFHAGWVAACELQAGQKPSNGAIELAFGLLARFDLASEIAPAIGRHCGTSTYVPRPAEIIRLIEGALPSDEVLLELATVNRTPLGNKVRTLLGSHAMTTAHPKALVSRVAALRSEAEDFHRRCLVGEQSDAELRAMSGAGIDACAELASGASGTRTPFRAAVAERQRTLGSPVQIEHDDAAPLSDAEREAGREASAKILSMLRGVA